MEQTSHVICCLERPHHVIGRSFSLARVRGESCSACRESLIFDTGTIKLADFGLSKSLPVNKHAGYDLDSKFKLTGETGSYRYMAPEVFRHEPYNYKVRAHLVMPSNLRTSMTLCSLLHSSSSKGVQPLCHAQLERCMLAGVDVLRD